MDSKDLSDLSDLSESFEDMMQNLSAVEKKIALRLGVPENKICEIVVDGLKSSSLEEDDLISEWIDAYNSFSYEASGGYTMEGSPVSEELAKHVHEMWSRWMRHISSKCSLDSSGNAVIPARLVQHWTWLSNLPWEKLPCGEQWTDQEEARKITKIFLGEGMNEGLAVDIPAILRSAEVGPQEE